MDKAGIKDAFTGCSFEKTDGFRYVLCSADNAATVAFMEALGIAPTERPDEKIEYQLTESECRSLGENGAAAWEFVTEQTEGIPYSIG